MDLISMVSSQLGLPETQAKALTGAMMGMVKSQADDDTTAALAEAVPEMAEWEEQADAVAAAPAPESGGMLGGLMSAASSGIGGSLLGAVAGEQAAETAKFAAVLSAIGLSQDKAMMAAPLVLNFLKERLPAGALDMVLKAAPFLTGGSKTSSAASALGGLFGGNS